MTNGSCFSFTSLITLKFFVLALVKGDKISDVINGKFYIPRRSNKCKMPIESKVEPPEGPVPQKPLRLRRFEEDEIPFEIGSLEKDEFSYIGDWQISFVKKDMV